MRTLTILFYLGIFVLVSVACTEQAEEAAISELAVSAANLAEKRDIGGLQNLATTDFQLVPDGLDRKGAKWALYRYFRQLGQFKVMIPKPEIDVDVDDSTAQLKTPVAIGPRNYNPSHLSAFNDDHVEWRNHLGAGVDVFLLEATLVKEREMWFVQSARLTRQ